MLGNPWHAALMGSCDVERRRELCLQQRLCQGARAWADRPAARLQVWMGSRLIQAGEALRQAGHSVQRQGPREAGANEAWRARPSRI